MSQGMFLGDLGAIPLVCPKCGKEGLWFLATEYVMCDWCMHDWPTIDALKQISVKS